MSSKTIQKNVQIAFDSIDQLVEQCNQAWVETRNIKFDDRFKKIQNVIVCGMGGSSLPTHIINAVFKTKVPIVVNENYHLPAWAGKNTLVLLSSYSGTTEETLSCGKDAHDKGCLITGVTSGGTLGDFLKSEGVPYYDFDPVHNPSNMPRYGIGYGMFGQLGLLCNLDLLAETTEVDLHNTLMDSIKHLSLALADINASAEEIVEKLKDRVLILFSAEHLKGSVHTFANQLNETSKALSFFVELPEIDHNLLEGFERYHSQVCAVFIESDNYSKRLKERLSISREIIASNQYQAVSYKPVSGTPMQEMLELLVFTSITSVLLAEAHDQDPLAIPSIDYIKGKLALTS